MNKKLMIAFALGAIVLLGTGFVFAYQGNPEVNGPNYSSDRHEAMQEIMDNVDYDAWVLLMTEDDQVPGVLKKITEENFAVFAEANKALNDGDYELATELRESLGIWAGQNKGSGTGCAKAEGGCQHAEGKLMTENQHANCPYSN